jgi:hypothetical protein
VVTLQLGVTDSAIGGSVVYPILYSLTHVRRVEGGIIEGGLVQKVWAAEAVAERFYACAMLANRMLASSIYLVCICLHMHMAAAKYIPCISDIRTCCEPPCSHCFVGMLAKCRVI